FVYSLLQPSSLPLFPYTTLFRSHRSIPPAPSAGPCSSRCAPSLPVPGLSCENSRRPCSPMSAWTPHWPHADPTSSPVDSSREPRDRKSTRLNSSHVSISYAVFCL